MELRAKGFSETIKRLKDAARRTKDLRPALRVTAEEFKSEIDRAFIESRSIDGTPWAKLADSTREEKERLDYSPKPLIRRGARGLQGQVTVFARKDAVVFSLGPLVSYGVYHQFEGGGKLPARPFLPFTGKRSGSSVTGIRLVGGAKVERIVQAMKDRVARYVATGKI